MRQFRQLSPNQKTTIVISIVIPLLVVLIPIIYENLNKPKIEVFEIGPSCEEGASSRFYILMVENTGRIAATNLEIRMNAKASVVFDIGNAPSGASISVTPYLDHPESGIDKVVIRVPTFPPFTTFGIVMMDDLEATKGDPFLIQAVLPQGVAIDIQDIWYDQGHIGSDKEFSACPPKAEATFTPSIALTSTP